jgi:hypothetical protein
MKTTTHQQQTAPETSGTAASILARISAEQVVPTPRYAFLLREYTLWSLWVLSIVLGALAVAVTVYDALSMTYALYEATHDNVWTFLVSVVPYVWLAVFAIMTVAAVRGLRATKRGYRYSTWFIITSSVVCSVLGSMLFHTLGFGFWLDNILGRQIDQYMSMEKMELGMWQAPSQGRLIGALVSPAGLNPADESAFLFKDSDGQVWTIASDELNERDRMLLLSSNRVRLLGTTTDATTFHVCGVFPWMYARAMGWNEMQHERIMFEKTMFDHRRMSSGGGDSTNGQTPDLIPTNQLCAHLKMMTRMRQ